MLQAICECGRIGEVRRRKNGKKLRFLHCVKCGTNLGSTETAKKLESVEREDIGTKGEFPETGTLSVPENSKLVIEPVTAAIPEPVRNEWKPEAAEMPEVLEPEASIPENSKLAKGPDSSGGSNTWKILAGVCVSCVLGGGIYVACKGQ